MKTSMLHSISVCCVLFVSTIADNRLESMMAQDGYAPASSIDDVYFWVEAPGVYSFPEKVVLAGPTPSWRSDLVSKTLNSSWNASTGPITVSERVSAGNGELTLVFDGSIDSSLASGEDNESKLLIRRHSSMSKVYFPRLESNPLISVTAEIECSLDLETSISPPDTRWSGLVSAFANVLTARMSVGSRSRKVTNDNRPSANSQRFKRTFQWDLTHTNGRYPGSEYHPDAAAVLWPTTCKVADGKTLRCFSVPLNKLLEQLSKKNNAQFAEASNDPSFESTRGIGDFELSANWFNKKHLPYSKTKGRVHGSITFKFEYSKLPKRRPFSFDLTRATTKDSKSVSITFDASGAKEGEEVEFHVYRSSAPVPTFTMLPIGTQKVKVLPGSNQELNILKGTDIAYDKQRPYILVISKAGNDTDNVYFRKWKLLAMTHGFAFLFDSDKNKQEYISRFREGGEAMKDSSQVDDFILTDWLGDCWKPIPNMTTFAGQRLATQVTEYIGTKATAHPGDVVDVHFMGHSRGAVVVSEALYKLSTDKALAKYLDAGLNQVTLVDAHPANLRSNDLRSRADTPGGRSLDAMIKDHQERMQDSDIRIPKGVGIQKVQVFYQHTTFDQLQGMEGLVNLWGIGEADNKVQRRIVNNSGASETWYDYSGKAGHSSIVEKFLSTSN